jgi:hypothetical protein
MIGSAPSCAIDIQKFRILSYSKMGLAAAAPQNFSQLFCFVSQARSCRGGTNISYSVVPMKKEDLDGVPQASSFSYADGLGDKSSFITTELHQLPVYGEQQRCILHVAHQTSGLNGMLNAE